MDAAIALACEVGAVCAGVSLREAEAVCEEDAFLREETVVCAAEPVREEVFLREDEPEREDEPVPEVVFLRADAVDRFAELAPESDESESSAPERVAEWVDLAWEAEDEDRLFFLVMAPAPSARAKTARQRRPRRAAGRNLSDDQTGNMDFKQLFGAG